MPSSDDSGHELQNLKRMSCDEEDQEKEEEQEVTTRAGKGNGTSNHQKRSIAMPSTGSSERYEQDEEGETQPLTGSGSAVTRSLYEHGLNDKLNRRTVRKLDTILLPFLSILFLLNSLDKSNIGNAETAGFTFDTGLSRQDVNTSMGIFFFVFVLLQPLGAALGRKYGMRRYVPVCMSLWGMSTVLHIFVRRRWHLIVLRVMIATLEAGFYPTTVSYMSLFYTKYEFGLRLAFFYGMTAIAGVVGGVLSWGIFSEFPGHHHDDQKPSFPPPRRDVPADQGWKSWEILFLVEGCLTMTIALVGFIWLPRSADSAWFLKNDERQWAEARMRQDTVFGDEMTPEEETIDQRRSTQDERYDSVNVYEEDPLEGTNDTPNDNHHSRLLYNTNTTQRIRRVRSAISAISITADSGLTKQDILSAIFTYKIWLLLLCNILSAIPATAFGVLLPILVKELSPSLNLSPAASNLLSAPPFALGALVLFGFTIWSDRSRERLVPIFTGLLLLLIGLTMTIVAPMSDYWLRYFSLCVLLSGSFIASPLTVAWLANNTPEPGKRAILLGINGWGNLAGVFMPILFRPSGRVSGYVHSFAILLVCVLASLVGFVIFRVFIIRENQFRKDISKKWSEEESEREELLGDVPVPEHGGQKIARRLGISRLKIWMGGDEGGRRGDERITFRYGL